MAMSLKVKKNKKKSLKCKIKKFIFQVYPLVKGFKKGGLFICFKQNTHWPNLAKTWYCLIHYYNSIPKLQINYSWTILYLDSIFYL